MLLPIALDRRTYTSRQCDKSTFSLTNLRLLGRRPGRPAMDREVGCEDVLQQLTLLRLRDRIDPYHDVVPEPVLHGALEHEVLNDAAPAVDLHHHLSLVLHLECQLDVGMSVALATPRYLTQHHLQVLVLRLLPVPIVLVQLRLTSTPSLQHCECYRRSAPASPREGTTASTHDAASTARPG